MEQQIPTETVEHGNRCDGPLPSSFAAFSAAHKDLSRLECIQIYKRLREIDSVKSERAQIMYMFNACGGLPELSERLKKPATAPQQSSSCVVGESSRRVSLLPLKSEQRQRTMAVEAEATATSLLKAVRDKQPLEEIRSIVMKMTDDQKQQLPSVDYYGNNSLHLAIKNREMELVENLSKAVLLYLIDKFPELLKEVDSIGRLPLHQALLACHVRQDAEIVI